MRSKKALLNIIVKFLSQMVTLICGLITPRLILQAFGSTYNGAISSITQFLSMISILTIGLAGATRVELYKTLANDDVLGTSRIIKATDKYLHKVGYAFIGYTILLSLIYPFTITGELPWLDSFLLVIILAIATFAQYFFGLSYSTLLQADQREYIYTLFQIVANILNTIIAVIMIYAGANIFMVKLMSSSLFAATPFFMHWYVRKNYRLVSDCEADKIALNQRSSVMFHSIANIVHDNTDILLLTLFTDAKTISVYTVYYLIVRNVKQIMQNFVTGLEAAFGNMWVKKEYDAFRKNFSTYEFLIFSFSSVVFTCVGLLLTSFISLYTKGITDTNYIRPAFAVLVTVAEGIFCIRQPYITIVQAAGKYKETRNGAVMEAIINLAISLFLINIIGLEGVIVGTLVANIFRTLQYSIFSSKHLLNRKILYSIGRCAWHILNTILIVVVYSPISRVFVVDSWGKWILSGIICFTIAVIVTAISGWIMYHEDFKQALVVSKRIISRKRK